MWVEELRKIAREKRAKNIAAMRPAMELEVRRMIELAASSGKFHTTVYLFEGTEFSTFEEEIQPHLEKEGLTVAHFPGTEQDRGCAKIYW